MNCKFCYRHKKGGVEKDLDFWLDLIPYFKKLGIPQIAAGGGEPLMKPYWIMELARKSREHGLFFNMTTNGKLIEKVPLKTFKDITMLSISFDDEKIKNAKDYTDFISSIMYLKQHYPKLKIGVNYLCDKKGLANLVNSCRVFFDKLKVDRVFALCPKNIEAEILKHRGTYTILTTIYPNFMVDDLTKCIIESGKYRNWEKPCHFGKIISIDEEGNIGGCSFDLGKVKCLTLKEPKDIMLVKDIQFKERHSCPYLKERR